MDTVTEELEKLVRRMVGADMVLWLCEKPVH